MTVTSSPSTATITPSLNRDRYYLRRINRDAQVHPPAPAARLYKAPSSSPSGRQFTNNRYSCLGDLSLLPLFAAFFCISIACTARTVPARAEPPEPRLAAEILLGIGGR
jgi:hypothetical protein